MKQLKGVLFVKGVYREKINEGEHLDWVEVLCRNQNNKWEVLTGSLDKTKEGYIFKEETKGNSFKLLLGRVKKAAEISGFMDLDFGACFESDDREWAYQISSFPELLAEYLNGNRQIIITGNAAEYIPGNCERWAPIIFRNVESITPRGFYVKGKFWRIEGSLRMKAK